LLAGPGGLLHPLRAVPGDFHARLLQLAREVPAPGRLAMIPAHVLAQVPGCAGARRPLAVVPLPGGEGRNEVVRIDTREGRFVWRRRLPPVNRPGALAQAELAAHRLAAAAGLAPVVLRAAPDGSWLLMEYVEGRPWNESDLLDPAGARRLGER